jgi:hypothetical protein
MESTRIIDPRPAVNIWKKIPPEELNRDAPDGLVFLTPATPSFRLKAQRFIRKMFRSPVVLAWIGIAVAIIGVIVSMVH